MLFLFVLAAIVAAAIIPSSAYFCKPMTAAGKPNFVLSRTATEYRRQDTAFFEGCVSMGIRPTRFETPS